MGNPDRFGSGSVPSEVRPDLVGRREPVQAGGCPVVPPLVGRHGSFGGAWLCGPPSPPESMPRPPFLAAGLLSAIAPPTLAADLKVDGASAVWRALPKSP